MVVYGWPIDEADWTKLDCDSFQLTWTAEDDCHEQTKVATLNQIIVIKDVTKPSQEFLLKILMQEAMMLVVSSLFKLESKEQTILGLTTLILDVSMYTQIYRLK